MPPCFFLSRYGPKVVVAGCSVARWLSRPKTPHPAPHSYSLRQYGLWRVTSVRLERCGPKPLDRWAAHLRHSVEVGGSKTVHLSCLDLCSLASPGILFRCMQNKRSLGSGAATSPGLGTTPSVSPSFQVSRHPPSPRGTMLGGLEWFWGGKINARFCKRLPRLAPQLCQPGGRGGRAKLGTETESSVPEKMKTPARSYPGSVYFAYTGPSKASGPKKLPPSLLSSFLPCFLASLLLRLLAEHGGGTAV